MITGANHFETIIGMSRSQFEKSVEPAESVAFPDWGYSSKGLSGKSFS